MMQQRNNNYYKEAFISQIKGGSDATMKRVRANLKKPKNPNWAFE